MFKVNDNFLKLPGSYLFSDIARRISEFSREHPHVEIIRMGIGDVTRPICPAVVSALHEAAEEQSRGESFHGYGPEQGYDFLREAIAQTDYRARGVEISADEVFVSDGAKSDTGNFGDILALSDKIALTDPVYPVYIDTNVMAGRAGVLGKDGRWSNIEYLPCTAENGFVPALPEQAPDVIYLCYPNNPTGTTLTRSQLKEWVEYALVNGALILFDAAYEAYITEDDVPHSIYEIEGAKRCAVEFRSFSKTAGFTGLRCGYTVVPKELMGEDSEGNPVSMHKLWNRRQTTKFNGASYVIQKGAAAIYTDKGQRQVREGVEYYMENARIMREAMVALGIEAFGGINSPYVWLKTPAGMSSWQFFDALLHNTGVVGTPGVGFGPSGEGYFRLTAFNTHEATRRAMERFADLKL